MSVCARAHAAASWRLRHFPACDTLPPGECEAAREFRALIAQLLSANCSTVRLSLKQLVTGNSIQGVSTVFTVIRAQSQVRGRYACVGAAALRAACARRVARALRRRRRLRHSYKSKSNRRGRGARHFSHFRCSDSFLGTRTTSRSLPATPARFRSDAPISGCLIAPFSCIMRSLDGDPVTAMSKVHPLTNAVFIIFINTYIDIVSGDVIES